MTKLPEESCCPDCGAKPTDDSIVETRLSDLGYQHEDASLRCSECEKSWTVGIPRGETDDDTWVCDACGGDFIPHFVYVYSDKEEVRVKPKCQDCNWVPDDPIVMDVSRNGSTVRFFVGHHSVTGSREDTTMNTL